MRERGCNQGGKYIGTVWYLSSGVEYIPVWLPEPGPWKLDYIYISTYTRISLGLNVLTAYVLWMYDTYICSVNPHKCLPVYSEVHKSDQFAGFIIKNITWSEYTHLRSLMGSAALTFLEDFSYYFSAHFPYFLTSISIYTWYSTAGVLIFLSSQTAFYLPITIAGVESVYVKTVHPIIALLQPGFQFSTVVIRPILSKTPSLHTHTSFFFFYIFFEINSQ